MATRLLTVEMMLNNLFIHSTRNSGLPKAGHILEIVNCQVKNKMADKIP
jgi:hypothetical protein